MAQNVVTIGQALSLYMAYIQEQIRRISPAMRNVPVLVVGDPRTGQYVSLSYPQMLSEVQRRTALGTNEAVKHARALGYTVVQ